MRNVYLYIVFLLIGFNSFGQDLRNSNWLFGHKAWLNFSSSTPVSLNGSAMDILEGCASVSDQLGNLLFYTNGMTVWNKNHQPMLNGSNTLISSPSNDQGVIIVPRPGNPNRYFVIYIDGYTGNRKGLRFSEVDMSNGIGEVVLATRNTILKDHNGVSINESYSNESQKLTSTIHSNGIDYWVLTQIKNYVYSYQVTSSGIGNSNLPNSYTVSPVTLISTNSSSSPGIGSFKISPNNQRIAIAYKDYARINSSDTFVYGAIITGTFDNTNGSITLNALKKFNNLSIYSLEFSPNNNSIYFTNSAIGGWISQLYVMNSDGSVYTLNDLGAGQEIGALQRAINNKIYLSKYFGNKLWVLDTPNDYINPNFHEDSTSLGNNGVYGGLPQLVPWQETCTSNLVLVSPTHNVAAPAQDNRQASGTITASNIIDNGAIGVYHAGNDVVLKPGFHSVAGSKSRIYIEGCSDQFTNLSTSSFEETSMRTTTTDADSSLAEQEENKPLFTLYPNPSIENVTITSDKVMLNITVTSLDGYAFFQKNIKGGSYELNISNYPKGFYVVTVTTDDGQMEKQKLIKI